MNCRRCPNKTRPGWRGYCKKHYFQVLRNDGRESGWLPSDEARTHLVALRKAGVRWVQLIEMSGMGEKSLRYLHDGKTERIQVESAKRILAMRAPTSVPDADKNTYAFTPAIGTVRRLQALQAMGYTQQELATRLGNNRWTLGLIARQNAPEVRVSTARKVDKLFRNLQLLPPPDTSAARRARTLAAKRGWVLPFCWDEDDIDNPLAKPFVPTGFTTKNRMEWYQKLRAKGLNDGQIAKEMNISPSSLSRWLQRQRVA